MASIRCPTSMPVCTMGFTVVVSLKTLSRIAVSCSTPNISAYQCAWFLPASCQADNSDNYNHHPCQSELTIYFQETNLSRLVVPKKTHITFKIEVSVEDTISRNKSLFPQFAIRQGLEREIL
jgi:hypothetical protein